MPKTPPDKFDEELGRVEFEELEHAQRRYRTIGNTIVFLIIIAGLIWLGWKLWQRQRKHPPAVHTAPSEVENQNIWVPGIDYQPRPDEGD